MLTTNIKYYQKDRLRNKRFETAFEYLASHDLTILKPGSELDLCEGVILKVLEYETRPREGELFERHEAYYDIQYVVSGSEFIGIQQMDGMTIKTPYYAQKDVVYYHDPEIYNGVILRAGDFAVITPDEAHKPNCRVTIPETVRKIVVKVKA